LLNIILIHSPLVGPSTLTPTADALTELGMRCHVPSPINKGDELPRWRDWTSTLIDELPMTNHAVIVGHSMGGLLAARLASELAAAGVVCLDANIPPETGYTPTVDPAFHEFVKSLPHDDGLLPPWQDWWPVDAFGEAHISPELKLRILNEIPRLQLGWFDDAFDMPNWADTKKAFLRTSPIFIEEANKASALGWSVVKLRGTHMHPTIQPDETAEAIILCCQQMGLM